MQANAALHFDSPGFRALSQAVLSSGSSIRFHARGLSMQPNILDGDVVVVAPVLFAALHIGDVVLTEAADTIRLHRIISIDGRHRLVLTRGDASLESDRPAKTVMGRVTAVNRNGRSISFEGQFAKARQAGNRLLRRIQLAIAVRAVKVDGKSNHTHG